jgi:BASS family bile acid:Na+ symporter
MNINQVINLLATVTLIEMMVTIGLGVMLADVFAVAMDWRLVSRAAIANYVLVPGAAIGLLLLFGASPMVAAGILIPAVCPGAPYGPPVTAMAKGNVALAVGLMVLLAGSSAIVAPLLLGVLLPLMARGEALRIDAAAMVVALLVTQFLPLCAGLYLAQRHAAVARRMKRPMARLSTVLNLTLLAVIIAAQYRTLAEIRLVGYLGMLALLASSVLAGWVVAGAGRENRKALALTTSIRNVGLGLVIVTRSFPGTPAVTATTAYGLFQTVLMALVALGWGRWTPAVEAAGPHEAVSTAAGRRLVR